MRQLEKQEYNIRVSTTQSDRPEGDRGVNEKEAARLHKQMSAQSESLDQLVEDSQAKLKKLLAEKPGSGLQQNQ